MKKLQKKLFLFIMTVTLGMGTSMMAQERIYHDLDDMRANNLDNAMEAKGYVHIKTESIGERVYGFWWNNQTKKCACSNVADGRVQSIVRTPSSDCNKSSEGAANHYNSYQHKINDHAENRHYDQQNLEESFERGFVDGLHAKNYHNVYTGDGMTKAYASGYSAGSLKHQKITAHHTNGAGYETKDFVDWKDLVHKDANQSYEVLKARGFRDLHTSSYNGGTFKYFHNKETGQCIETVQKGGHLTEIRHYEGCNQFMN